MKKFRLVSRPWSTNFIIRFDNDYEISMAIGDTAHDDSTTKIIGDEKLISSPNIECAVFAPGGQFMQTPWTDERDEVSSRLSPNEVLKLMNWTAEQKKRD